MPISIPSFSHYLNVALFNNNLAQERTNKIAGVVDSLEEICLNQVVAKMLDSPDYVDEVKMTAPNSLKRILLERYETLVQQRSNQPSTQSRNELIRSVSLNIFNFTNP